MTFLDEATANVYPENKKRAYGSCKRNYRKKNLVELCKRLKNGKRNRIYAYNISTDFPLLFIVFYIILININKE